MENFGLFRLLTALSGLNEPNKETTPSETAQPQEQTFAAKNTPENDGRAAETKGVFTDEERRKRAEQILARHEAISRRIDRRGKT